MLKSNLKKAVKIHLRLPENLRSGHEDHLVPLKPLDLSKIKKFSDLTDAMSQTAFGGRLVGEAVDVLVQMAKDKDAFVVLTLSGAMTIAKMGLLVCDMIDRGLVQAIVSTGALMAHGLIEGQGMSHFKVPHDMNDEQMYVAGYDRVYDTLELEKNLDDTENLMFGIFESLDPKKVLCSRFLNEEIGKYLAKKLPANKRAILKSAYLKGIPIYVPAFTDSELGLDLGMYNNWCIKHNKLVRHFDPFLDLDHYTKMINKQKKIGIFTIGGGVPRNWAQQVMPYLDLLRNNDFSKDRHEGKKVVYKEETPLMFSYGVRICPEPIYWGGFSGCTYSEGVSWGKFAPESLGSKFSEVLADATVVWPLILKAALEKLGKKVIKKNIFAGKKAVKKIEEEVENIYLNL